ncbi:MAG: hypothetical protein FGM14_10720 [Flavobacteriales bacterium]|nr:hypothetical protein [Flavobacteriales bacterium]
METTENISILELIIAFSGFFALLSIAFYGLFIAFKKRIEREQEALRKAEIDFERELGEATIKAEQQERVQIAMDLHDELGALVTVLNFNIINAKNRQNDPVKLQKSLDEASNLIGLTVDAIRQISNRISPPALVKLGLNSTIEELVKTINSAAKMHVEYESNLNETRFQLSAELNIYRIVKETINNILKYGKSELLTVNAQLNANELQLDFQYKGIGLTNEEVENLLHSTKGSGLKSIQSRVNNLKATISYLVANQDEAKISVKIPLDEIKN